MLINNRIIYSDDGVLNDLSVTLSDLYDTATTLPIVAADDAIYIASDLPFNHRYIEVSTANDQDASISIYLWNGNAWQAAVDIIDQTKVAGKTLAQSGIISWTPDRLKNWSYQPDSNDISELSGTKIYDMYWVKIVFSDDPKATTAIKYIGHKFSTDNDLTSEYPEFASTSLKSAFEVGKTDWNTQTILAAEYIIEDLRTMNVITSSAQILDWRKFTKASIHKTAEIIFRAFGDDYKDNLQSSMAAYKKYLQVKAYNVDQNKDGRLNEVEKTAMSEYLTR